MDPTQAYYKDGTELILSFLKATFQDQYRAFWEGDPGEIPVSLMPCLVVWKQKGTSNPGPTGTQEVNETILIQVIVNKTEDFGAAKRYPTADMTNRRLRIAVEGRDENTAQYLDNTICGVLSKNITLGQNVLEMNISTDYLMARRGNGLLTSEAHVTVQLRERIVVRSRT